MKLTPDERKAFQQVINGLQAAVLLIQATEHNFSALKSQIDRAAGLAAIAVGD